MGVMMCAANKATDLHPCDCGIVICNECGRTGLESHPDDYCSRAVRAE